MVRKREDGRWEGRIVVGHKENGDPLFRWPSFTVTWISIRTHSSLRTAV